MTGNQHKSPRRTILKRLREARACLARAASYRRQGADGPARAALQSARYWLSCARDAMAAAPASTHRRWACGR